MDKDCTETYRYERKFSITDLCAEEVLHSIKCNRALFSSMYPERYVNNLYFESHALQSFFETVNGVGNREKYRLRWYGDLSSEEMVKPQFEIKIRKGMVNTKKVYGLNEMSVHPLCAADIKKSLTSTKEIPADVKRRIDTRLPILINRYKREYFISSDGKYRLTLDRDIQYFSGRSPKLRVERPHHQANQIVVEIKYSIDDDNTASRISSQFPFRLTRNSKYTNGIELLKQHCLL